MSSCQLSVYTIVFTQIRYYKRLFLLKAQFLLNSLYHIYYKMINSALLGYY